MQAATVVRTLRLVTGLVLMTFVLAHLANLALGLRSLETMEAWRATLVGPWQSTTGRLILGSCALVHTLLGLYAMASRRSLSMSRTDWVQLTLGLVTPPLLFNHVLMTAVASELVSGYEPSYGLLLSVYWSIAPIYAIQQLFVAVFIWTHAALGLYCWLVLKPVWGRIGPVVLPLLFAVPIAALLGFAESGKEVVDKLAAETEWRAIILETAGQLGEARARLDALQAQMLTAYGVLALLALAVLFGRLLRNSLTSVRIDYDGGLFARGRSGLSILELSRMNEIPHADVCSGRGRCGTCRVHVDSGASALSAPGAAEQHVLARSNSPAGDRLACQALVMGSGVSVTRALPAFADATAARRPGEWAQEEAVAASGAAP